MKQRKYHWPLPIDPEAYKCIKVYIPEDSLYLGQFWQAYQHFTRFFAWEKDDLHTGSQVAEIWRAGYDLARAEYEAGQGCGEAMPNDFRDKPSNINIVQYSKDGGTVWIDGWTKLGQTTVLAQPKLDTDKRVRNMSGTILKNGPQEIAKRIVDVINASGTKEDAVAAACDWFGGIGGDCPTPTVEAIYDDLAAMTQEQRNRYAGDCAYDEVDLRLQTYLTNNENWMGGFGQWLGTITTELTDVLVGTLMETIGYVLDDFFDSEVVKKYMTDPVEDYRHGCVIPYNNHQYKVLGPYDFTATKATTGRVNLKQVLFEVLALEHYIGMFCDFTCSPSEGATCAMSNQGTQNIPPGYSITPYDIDANYLGGGGQTYTVHANAAVVGAGFNVLNFLATMGMTWTNLLDPETDTDNWAGPLQYAYNLDTRGGQSTLKTYTGKVWIFIQQT